MKAAQTFQVGDLAKLQVPPFNFGIVVDVIDWLREDEQMIALMLNPSEYDKLTRVSKIAHVSLFEIQRYLRIFAGYGSARKQVQGVESFLRMHTTISDVMSVSYHKPAIVTIKDRSKAHVSTCPVAIINTHMNGRRIIRPIRQQ